MDTITFLIGILIGILAGAAAFYLASFAALRDTRDRWLSRLEDHRAGLLALIMAAELRGWGTASSTLHRMLKQINDDIKKARNL